MASFRGDSFSPEPVEEPAPAVKPEPAPVAKPAGPPVNLTIERRVKYLQGQCVSECNKVDEYDVVKAAVHKKDADGNVVIRDGLPVTETREMLARDQIKLRYSRLIDAARAGKL